MRWPVALLLAVAPSCGDTPTARPGPSAARITLAALAPGDELRVAVHAHGCFHDHSASLSFRSTAQGSVRLTGRVAGNYARQPEWSLDMSLDRTRLQDLDADLAYYRDLPSDGLCTSVVELHLALYRDGALVQRERYRDDTCGGFDPPPPPATSFASLIERR